MGQMMRYHELPTIYNWTLENFPFDHGTNEIAQLLVDIGNAVNMIYGCDGSGAHVTAVEPAFENEFGYSTTTYYTNYSRNTVKNEIDNNRPVYLRGDGTAGGHAFVADGYMIVNYYTCEENPYIPGEFWKSLNSSTYPYFHMNWGWYGTSNGYYSWNDWSPGALDFNNNKKMVVVRP